MLLNLTQNRSRISIFPLLIARLAIIVLDAVKVSNLTPLVKDKVAPLPPRSHRGEGFLRHLTYAITPRANFVA